MPEFDKLEQKIVRLSAARYQRPFYRWGHLLGWLAPALFFLFFVPSLKPYQFWIYAIAIMLIFEWYHVVTTRVIGKLHAQVQANAQPTSR